MTLKNFDKVMNITLIVLMTILVLGEGAFLAIGSKFCTNYLECKQATYLTTFGCGMTFSLLCVILCIFVDWGVCELFDLIRKHLSQKCVEEPSKIYADIYGSACPLGGSSSRERCDYCTHFKGEMNGKEYKNKGYFMCNKL